VYALAGLWTGLTFSTWLAVPLSNLVLMLHPIGRHALDDDQKASARAVAALLGIALLGVVGFAAGIQGGLYLAVTCALATLPAAVVWRADEGWPRKVLGLLVIAAIVTGACAAALALVSTGKFGEASPAWTFFWVSLGLSIVGMWASVPLRRARPAH
jgi:hypothetical protein